LERRLLALERSYEKLRAAIDPLFAVANVAAPIAASLLKVDGQHAFSAKFFALLDLGEAAIKYSAAVAFAAVTQTHGSQASDVAELFKKPPSLGKVVEQLRKILADSSAPPVWPMNLVFESFRRPNGKQTSVARYLFDEFIAIRNSERGHGTQQPEGYYEELYLKNRTILEDFVLSSQLLSTTLVYIHSVDHHDEQSSYKVTRLMGAVPLGLPDPIITSTKVRMHSTCLWDRATRLLALDDFVVYRFCKQCGGEHTFFADCITTHRILLQSYPGSHRIDAKRT
jgi:hypothetical protein